VLDPDEVTMKEDSDDCIPQRKVFSALVTGAHPIPLLREDLIPQGYAQLLRSISMKCGIFLGFIDEVNAALRNNYFATFLLTYQKKVTCKALPGKQHFKLSETRAKKLLHSLDCGLVEILFTLICTDREPAVKVSVPKPVA
jgi:hypothetical protein